MHNANEREREREREREGASDNIIVMFVYPLLFLCLS